MAYATIDKIGYKGNRQFVDATSRHKYEKNELIARYRSDRL